MSRNDRLFQEYAWHVTNGVATDEGYRQLSVFPKNRIPKPVAVEIPLEFAKEFDEARMVFDISPKSSAALSRRVLQRILHQQFNIIKPTLQQENSGIR